jgi:Na+-transporting NADH:ubiquinone oxidoreductase subunit A
LRALSVGDLETARRLGCLELLEEDVSLLSYVCPSKVNYAPLLRSVLDSIKDGD